MASVKVELNGVDDLLKMFSHLPSLVVGKNGILENAVFKASLVVARRARQLAPDSKKNRKSNSRDKQSQKSKNIWNHKLRDTITQKTLTYRTATWAVVGPKKPQGNMAHFMQVKPRRHVLWGRSTAVQQYRIERDWIIQAFDETKSQQLSAMESTLRSDLDRMMRL